MSGGPQVDLAGLAAPDVVEALSYEVILATMKADLAAKDPALSAAVLESDPATKVLEVAAYREFILRQRVNDGARAVMLAHAKGADLDNIAANVDVVRLVVAPGDPNAIPPVPPTYESDDRLRTRVQMAPEAITTAGSEGAYIFHAMSASGLVADVSVTSPAAVQVTVTIMSTIITGVPDQALIDTVTAALNVKTVRPLTDQVTVQGGAAVDYAVNATLALYNGPDSAVVLSASEVSVTAFVAKQKRLGEMVTIDGLHKALRVEGVKKVTLVSPTADTVATPAQFPNCTGITVGVVP